MTKHEKNKAYQEIYREWEKGERKRELEQDALYSEGTRMKGGWRYETK